MRHHTDSLIKAVRVALHLSGRRNQYRAAIAHGGELMSEHGCLHTWLPAMRNLIYVHGIVAFDGFKAQINAGGENQSIVRNTGAIGEAHMVPFGIDCRDPALDHVNAVILCQILLAERNGIHVP